MACFISLAFFPGESCAGIKVKFIVANRSDEVKMTPVKYVLPEPIELNDVINAGDFQIVFDPETASCFVSGEVELNPRESRVFEIEVRDVWKISTIDLTRHREYSLYLAYVLRNSNFGRTAHGLAGAIANRAENIADSQTDGVSINQRIKHYKINRKRLNQIEQDIRTMKNFAREMGMLNGANGSSIMSGS